MVALPSRPKGNFLTFAESRAGGSAKGAAAGAFEGWMGAVQAMGPHAGDGMSAAVAGLGLLLGVVVGAVFGGIGGAAEAVPSDVAAQIRKQVDLLLSGMNLNQARRVLSGTVATVWSVARGRFTP